MNKFLKNNIKKIIKEYLKYFPKNIKIEKIFLFGSYAKGNYDEDSDIDLILISSDFKKIDFLKRLEMLSSFRKSKLTQSVAMDILGYTPEEFKNISKESIIIKKAIKEGKVIYLS
jgi:predicted nucleotidyltransferase